MSFVGEVLKILEAKNLAAPEPFAQNKQYKQNIDENHQEEPEELPSGSQAVKKKPLKKKKKAKRPAQIKEVAVAPDVSTGKYVPHEYSASRKQFISEKRLAGMAASEAEEEWKKSDVKRQLLSHVPLQELKRRKFVPKECEINPWAW